MSIEIVLFAILGWLFFTIGKMLEAKGKMDKSFAYGRYFGDQAPNLIMGLILVIVTLYSAREAFDTVGAAFTLGVGSQALLRNYLKKKTWKGLGLFK